MSVITIDCLYIRLAYKSSPDFFTSSKREQYMGSLTSFRIYICKVFETGPTVYRPYPKTLESLTTCKSLYKKAALFP